MEKADICSPAPHGDRPAGRGSRRPTANRIKNFKQAYHSWLLPYLKSRIAGHRFRPVLSFLYTDLNCNLKCPYCYSRGANIPGISMDTAKDAVNWLMDAGCRDWPSWAVSRCYARILSLR